MLKSTAHLLLGAALAALLAASAPALADAQDQYHQAPRDTVSQQVYDGWKQFELNCARCHGEYAVGTSFAPNLTVSLRDDGPINTKDLFTETVCKGRPQKGMPAWCSLGLESEKIEAIYTYVRGRAIGAIAPGRPAVNPKLPPGVPEPKAKSTGAAKSKSDAEPAADTSKQKPRKSKVSKE